jgi:CrcB protein
MDGAHRLAAETGTKAQRLARWRATALLYGAITLGSILGSVLRWLASLGMHAAFGEDFPWGTLFVNVTGSFAIGFYAALTAPGGRLFAGPRIRQFAMTGLCGGYTTFSMFSLETLELFRRGAAAEGALNVVISIATWLAAVWAGDALASRLNRLRKGG